MGTEWKDDPSTIPVDAIVEEWRAASKRGRYESAMWRAAGLEEPNYSLCAAHGPSRVEEAQEGEVDNVAAGGFYARYLWTNRMPSE